MPRTFPEFLRDQLGTDRWVVKQRLTPRLRECGYTVALTANHYTTLRELWERETYGAPLASLHDAAPELLALLRSVEGFCPVDWQDRIRAVVAKAEGRAN